MKFSSFYTTANSVNTLSPFANEGDSHFFDQPEYDANQNEVAEEEKPFSNKDQETQQPALSPWQAQGLYNDKEDETSSGSGFQNRMNTAASGGDGKTTAQTNPQLVPQISPFTNTGVQNKQNGSEGAGEHASSQENLKDPLANQNGELSSEGMQAPLLNKAPGAGSASNASLLQAGTQKNSNQQQSILTGTKGSEHSTQGLQGATESGQSIPNLSGATGLKSSGLAGSEQATKSSSGSNDLQIPGLAGAEQAAPNLSGVTGLQVPGLAGSGLSPKGIAATPGPANAIDSTESVAPGSANATDTSETTAPGEKNATGLSESASPGSANATETTTPGEGNSEANGDQQPESGSSNVTSPGNPSNAPGGSGPAIDRINAGRSVSFKPQIQSQAALIQASSALTEQQIKIHASERRAQVTELFANSRTNVKTTIEGNALAIQEVIQNQQTAALAAALSAIANIQGLITTTTASAQALIQTYQTTFSTIIGNATKTIQEGISGVAGEITGLINTVNLPDMPGLADARNVVTSVINNGATTVSNAMTGTISMIGNALNFGLNLLNGFVGIFGQMLGQAFSMVSNGIMTLLTLLINTLNGIMNTIIGQLSTLLNSMILPVLARVEAIAQSHITKSEEDHLKSVQTNRDQHLEMLANILTPTAAGAGAAAGAGTAGGGAASATWTIEKIGEAAVNNNTQLQNSFTKIVDLIFGNIVTDITFAVTRIVTEINTRINQFLGTIIKVATEIIQLIYSLITAITDFLGLMVTELVNVLTGLLNLITSSVTNPVTTALNAASTVRDRVRSAIQNIVNNFLSGVVPGSVPVINATAPSATSPTTGPTPAFAGGPIIIIGGKIIILIGTGFFIISVTTAIIGIAILLIILIVLAYLLYKWLTTPAPAPPPPPPPPPPPTGKEYSPGTPLVEDRSVPLTKTDIQVSQGEKILFGFWGDDQDQVRPIGTPAFTTIPGTGPYEVDWEVTGDADLFTPGSGIKGFTDPDKFTMNLEVFVDAAWAGTPLTVKATFRDNALPATPPDIGTTKDAEHVVEWTLKTRTNPCPTNLKRVAGPGPTWVTAPGIYTYEGRPHLPPPGTPSYENQTILESFQTVTALGFTMSDLKPAWKAANPTLNTPDKVAAFLWDAGSNGTFVFDSNDRIADQHDGFGTVDPFLPAALSRATGIGYRLPQTYTCGTTVVGTADIDRQFSTTTGLKIRKTGPS